MKLLQEYVSQFNVSLSDEQLALFEKYLQFLKTENEKVNLTAITERESIIEKHFIDSLSILQALPSNVFNGTLRLIDIGAGAGFPGIPIKLLFPQIHLTLVDSVQKKVHFLQRLAQELQLQNTICIADRAENIGQNTTHRERYDLVVARAVAEVNVLCEYCLPLLVIDGTCILYKAKDIDDELSVAYKAISTLGGKLECVEKFKLADNDRSLIVIKKVSPTPKAYPRETGAPGKKPLGV